MSLARDQVIALPELLELILSFLPTRDLLLAQGVSRSFAHAIRTSKRLQQLLFFVSKPLRSRVNTGSFTQDDFVVNQLLMEFLPAWFLRSQNKQTARTAFTETIASWPVEKLDAFLHADASWRRMLPISPAPTEFEVWSWTVMIGTCTRRQKRFRFSEGLRMGIMYDLAEHQIGATSSAKRRPLSAFSWSIQWFLTAQPKGLKDTLSEPIVLMRLSEYGGSSSGGMLVRRYTSKAAIPNRGEYRVELEWDRIDKHARKYEILDQGDCIADWI